MNETVAVRAVGAVTALANNQTGVDEIGSIIHVHSANAGRIHTEFQVKRVGEECSGHLDQHGRVADVHRPHAGCAHMNQADKAATERANTAIDDVERPGAAHGEANVEEGAAVRVIHCGMIQRQRSAFRTANIIRAGLAAPDAGERRIADHHADP